jgi:LacI family transcriptional regulator
MSQGSSAEHSVLWSQHASILSSGIQDTLIGTEYHLSVLAIPSFLHSAKETEIQDWLNRTNVTWGTDGLILTNPTIHDYLADNIMHSNLPTVAVGKCPISSQIPQIDIDNVEGFRILTMHVLSLGHRNVAFLGPDVDLTVHQDRMQGFRDAFTQSGIPLPHNWWLKTRPTDFVSSFRDARTRTLEAIDSGELPSCIMAFNDEMAYGVIQALVSRGLRVPQDVSVTGFDDLPSTVMFAPPLTTVRQDMRLIGQYAGRTLLREIQDGRTTPSLIVLPVELVVRDSTAAV